MQTVKTPPSSSLPSKMSTSNSSSDIYKDTQHFSKSPLTLQNDYFSQLRKCIRFDPRRYIAGAVIAFFICLVVLIVYHKRHKKQKDKENRKIGSYGGGCNDRHDEKTIKEVLQHIHPETYGQPKDSWYETIKRNQSSAFKEDKTDYYPKET